MNPPAQFLTFSISPDDPLGILESMIASARRGGLTLAALRVQSAAHGLDVGLTVSAGEPERIELFAARLDNIFGLGQIQREEILSAFLTPASSDQPDEGVTA